MTPAEAGDITAVVELGEPPSHGSH
jgi:hypothetical protein